MHLSHQRHFLVHQRSGSLHALLSVGYRTLLMTRNGMLQMRRRLIIQETGTSTPTDQSTAIRRSIQVMSRLQGQQFSRQMQQARGLPTAGVSTMMVGFMMILINQHTSGVMQTRTALNRCQDKDVWTSTSSSNMDSHRIACGKILFGFFRCYSLLGKREMQP